MMAPRHRNPATRERTALAPYNFVPLPNAVFTVEDGKDTPWRQHDRFVPGTYSGWIDLRITTLTPLYIRGAAQQNQEDVWDTRDARFRPEPSRTPDERPLIPGASLRGAVRNLFEIITFSKIQPVSKERPFFRSVGKHRMAKEYRKRIVQGETAPRGGFIRRRDGAWVIEPAQATWRVHHSILRRHGLEYKLSPDYKPTWNLQHDRCWFRPGAKGSVAALELKKPNPANGWREGVLVLTGSSPRKEREFLFVEAADPQRIAVPDAIWKRFHDDDQITQWQERAFRRNEPAEKCRKRNGHLRDGEPVFFLCDHRRKTDDNPAGLVFFGRAQMFRFPYDLSPNDLVQRDQGTDALDLAEVVFGRVGQERNKRGQALKGRVFVEDSVAMGEPPAGGWLESVFVPKILSAPKPTTFQHYLTQDGTKSQEELTTYFDGERTSIRGHKVYWHRWNDKRLNLVREGKNQEEILEYLQKQQGKSKDESRKFTQYTIIQPVKAGVTFEGRIRFENLTNIELGALLAVLELPAGCAHKLGMGKPLGLGSVRIEATFRFVDHNRRYTAWQDSGIVDEDSSTFQASFTNVVLSHAEKSHETLLEDRTGLRRIARLDALYHLLSWERRPALKDTRYMVIERGDEQHFPADKQGKVNEYRERPVLPSPHGVMSIKEPPWGDEPPRPGPGLDSASTDQEGRFTSASPSLPSSNDRVEGVLLEGKTKKGGWRTRHAATNIAGPIQNSDDVPGDRKPGDKLILIVASANQREIGFRYPTEADDARSKSSGKPQSKPGRQQRRPRRR